MCCTTKDTLYQSTYWNYLTICYVHLYIHLICSYYALQTLTFEHPAASTTNHPQPPSGATKPAPMARLVCFSAFFLTFFAIACNEQSLYRDVVARTRQITLQTRFNVPPNKTTSTTSSLLLLQTHKAYTFTTRSRSRRTFTCFAMQ